MKKILERYYKNKKDVQIFIRGKEMEGVIKSIQEDIVHLVDEKYEFHIPIEKIITIGCKLDKKDRKQKSDKNFPLGFKCD